MNILLWILQGVLALLCLAGGGFKIFKFDDLASAPFYSALPRAGWSAIGALEMLCGVMLIVPAAVKWMPGLTPVFATVLAVEALALAMLYAKYSVALTAANPMVWSVVTAVMAAFVAYGRYALAPSA
jgi:hypothetical protein